MRGVVQGWSRPGEASSNPAPALPLPCTCPASPALALTLPLPCPATPYRGLIYCMEYLEENLDEWLGEHLKVWESVGCGVCGGG